MILSEAGSSKEGVSEEIIDVLDKSVSRACKFYTLYYIDVELGIDGFDFYYDKELDLQYDALYNYSIFACGNELTNFGKHFAIDNFKIDDVLYMSNSVDHREKTKGARHLDEDVADDYLSYLMNIIDSEAPRELQSLIKDIMVNNHVDLDPVANERDLLAYINTLEYDYSAFTRHERFLRACKFIFGFNWGKEFSDIYAPSLEIEPRNNPNAFGWQVQYGGGGWANVPETALLRHEFDGKETFIDMMWAVEHNNGNFVDKLPFIDREEREVIKKALEEELNTVDDRYVNLEGPLTEQNILDIYNDRLMQHILDFSRSGNMRPVARIAIKMFTELKNRRLSLNMFPQDELLVKELENFIGRGGM
jgi:hypothetical protein